MASPIWTHTFDADIANHPFNYHHPFGSWNPLVLRFASCARAKASAREENSNADLGSRSWNFMPCLLPTKPDVRESVQNFNTPKCGTRFWGWFMWSSQHEHHKYKITVLRLGILCFTEQHDVQPKAVLGWFLHVLLKVVQVFLCKCSIVFQWIWGYYPLIKPQLPQQKKARKKNEKVKNNSKTQKKSKKPTLLLLLRDRLIFLVIAQ